MRSLNTRPMSLPRANICCLRRFILLSRFHSAFFHLGKHCSGKYEILKIDETREIAYKKTWGSKQPTIVLVPGFMSKMEGIKAQGLERYCRDQNRTFVRFDIEGLGKSPGDPRTIQMKHWIEDCEHVLHKLTEGPVVLVGYSMGGWGKARLESGKIYKFSNQHLEMFLRKDFAEKSRDHEIDLTKPIDTRVPTRILHGMKDGAVPYTSSLKIAELIQSEDVDVVLRKQELHPFSDPEDLELIYSNLTQLLRRYPVNDPRTDYRNSILKFT
ncbi:hypothetical protein J437_LFUL013200 [Ladona fulva]|uniref:Palmitoyl-protein thioesterase ABHD10, mitochondrial n=1 Tax=Ladona fulva TaxID=123851 RepID=A0A8K0KFH6_LADFU|nr:hypothetical protein J437_LFUL013200 [Ladona fulva]